MIETGKEEKARIRVEHLIREDFTMEALEIVQLLCELIHERVRHMVSEPECPPDLIGAVATLLYAAPRVDISELLEVKNQLTKKYGKKFVEEVTALDSGHVNPRVVDKLAVHPPDASAVVSYMKRVAEEFNVAW